MIVVTWWIRLPKFVVGKWRSENSFVFPVWITIWQSRQTKTRYFGIELRNHDLESMYKIAAMYSDCTTIIWKIDVWIDSYWKIRFKVRRKFELNQSSWVYTTSFYKDKVLSEETVVAKDYIYVFSNWIWDICTYNCFMVLFPVVTYYVNFYFICNSHFIDSCYIVQSVPLKNLINSLLKSSKGL